MSLSKKQKRLNRRGKAKKQKTMFGPAKHKKLAEVVSLESPSEAQESVDTLERMFDDAKTRKKKVTILRATVLAANRAEAMKIRVGPKERRELTSIAKKYRRSASGMSAILAKADKAKKGSGRADSSPSMPQGRGVVEVVIDPTLNRGKRWGEKSTRNMFVIVTYLDRAGNKKTGSLMGATKGHLFADERTTILRVEVPKGGKKATMEHLRQYGYTVR